MGGAGAGGRAGGVGDGLVGVVVLVWACCLSKKRLYALMGRVSPLLC